METKVCCKCKVEKDVTEFGKLLISKDGLNYSCKECQRIRTKKYTEENHDKVLKKQREWRQKNPDWVYERQKRYRLNNPDKIKQMDKSFYENNPDKKKEYRENYKPRKKEHLKERRKTDAHFRMVNNIRARIYRYLKKLDILKTNHTFDIVGCTPEFLKEHLETLFTDKMNWENYGQYGWHIDHIIPLDSSSTEEELHKLCHYTNLQPLWWLDNIKKGIKIL